MKRKSKNSGFDSEKKIKRYSAGYREAALRAASLTACAAAVSLIIPLKLKLEEDSISISSFLWALKLERNEKGFSIGITDPEMTLDDGKLLAKTMYKFYDETKSGGI